MNVFKKIVFAVLLSVGCKGIYAHEISLRGGFNLSQMRAEWDGEPYIKYAKLMPGFQVGPVINFPLNNNFSLESGLLYATKGIKRIGHYTVDQKTLYRLNMAYIELPLTIKISFPFQHVKLFVNGGTYFAQGLFGNIFSKEDINDSRGVREKVEWGDQENAYQRFDFGLNFGLGMKYKDLQLGICYENGIADISGLKRSERKINNRAAALYLSYPLWNKTQTKH